MAVTLTSPDGGENFYAHYNGTAMNTLNNAITWSGTTNNITIKYSSDGGTSWTNIATGISGALGTYDWSLDFTEWTAILGAQGAIEEEMRIKLVDETTADEDESAANFTMYEIPFSDIRPNLSNNSTDKINDNSIVNIVWDLLYQTGITTIDIHVRWYNVTWQAWTLIESGINNIGHYEWDVPSDQSIPDDVVCQIRITGGGTHSNCLAYSENGDGGTPPYAVTDGFTVTQQNTDTPHGANEYEKFPQRKEVHARLAIEKANLADEAISLSQLEAGCNIEIVQRDKDGKDPAGYNRSGIAANDPAAALNVIIKTKDCLRLPRKVTGIIDFINDTPTAGSIVAGNYYGNTYYVDIVHNWSLGNVSDSLFVTGQTKRSFDIVIDQITADIPSYDGDAQALGVVPWFDVIDEDTIRIYTSIKGTDKPGGGSADDDITLAKDVIGADVGTYIFEYHLVERLP